MKSSSASTGELFIGIMCGDICHVDDEICRALHESTLDVTS